MSAQSPMPAFASLRHRPVIGLAVLALTIQVLLPLRYYAGSAGPDERFAWRMFSRDRLANCTLEFAKAQAPLALAPLFHEAWLELARRGRRAVLNAMAQQLCARHEPAPLRLTLRCIYPDGEVTEFTMANACAGPVRLTPQRLAPDTQPHIQTTAPRWETTEEGVAP